MSGSERREFRVSDTVELLGVLKEWPADDFNLALQ